MTPTPAIFEVKRRPVWDPAPGSECIWRCLREKPLCMHRLSDRVLGSLHIAVDLNLINKSECNHSETDLAAGFKIRASRYGVHLGHPLFTPDGAAYVSIPVQGAKGAVVDFVLKGDSIVDLPAVQFDEVKFRDSYATFDVWLSQMLYPGNEETGYPKIKYYDFPIATADTAPPDWPEGVTRDRVRASEAHYRERGLDLTTGEPTGKAPKKKKATAKDEPKAKDNDEMQPSASSASAPAAKAGMDMDPLKLRNHKLGALQWLVRDPALSEAEIVRTLSESASLDVLEEALARCGSTQVTRLQPLAIQVPKTVTARTTLSEFAFHPRAPELPSPRKSPKKVVRQPQEQGAPAPGQVQTPSASVAGSEPSAEEKAAK